MAENTKEEALNIFGASVDMDSSLINLFLDSLPVYFETLN